MATSSKKKITRTKVTPPPGITLNVGNGGNDRVSFSFGGKVMIQQFEPQDYHVSYSSDVHQGETHNEAMERVKEFVYEHAKRSEDMLRTSIKEEEFEL